MRVLGFEVSIRKAVPKVLNTVMDNRGFFPWGTFTVQEPFAGAWQRNIAWTNETVLAYHAVYACITLISSDIGKLRPRLVQQDKNGIWRETRSAAFSPVLRKPNHFQNHIQFKQSWMFSKLTRGNTYVLLERDERGVVVREYVLDPQRVTPLVAPDGAVFYRLQTDNLAGLEDGVTVPASEIAHDRMPGFHPLVGISPLYACGTPANIGLQIQNSDTSFFANDSTPGGILTAPGPISEEQADKMSDRWKQRFSGENRGKVAILGNGLSYQQLRMSATDAQLIEHLRWTAEAVCSCFHVPAFKVGIGPMPTYSNGEILDQRYYSDCLQAHIEEWELCQDEALGVGEGAPKEGSRTLGVELDLDGLLRMDSATQIDTLSKAVGGGIMSPDEAREKIDLGPVKGGATPYLQQQNYSLAALDERDTSGDPFARNSAPAPTPAVPDDDENEDEDEPVERALPVVIRRQQFRTHLRKVLA